MDLKAELLRVASDVTQSVVGGIDVWRYKIITPRFTFENLVHFVTNEKALVIKARSSYSEELAAALLHMGLSSFHKAFATNSITVVPGIIHQSAAFNSLVFLPPNIAQCFTHESPHLEAACAWVFPAYDGEFSTGQGRKEFAYQIGRKDGWRVSIANWNRTKKAAPSYEVP